MVFWLHFLHPLELLPPSCGLCMLARHEKSQVGLPRSRQSEGACGLRDGRAAKVAGRGTCAYLTSPRTELKSGVRGAECTAVEVRARKPLAFVVGPSDARPGEWAWISQPRS